MSLTNVQLHRMTFSFLASLISHIMSQLWYLFTHTLTEEGRDVIRLLLNHLIIPQLIIVDAHSDQVVPAENNGSLYGILDLAKW